MQNTKVDTKRVITKNELELIRAGTTLILFFQTVVAIGLWARLDAYIKGIYPLSLEFNAYSTIYVTLMVAAAMLAGYGMIEKTERYQNWLIIVALSNMVMTAIWWLIQIHVGDFLLATILFTAVTIANIVLARIEYPRVVANNASPNS